MPALTRRQLLAAACQTTLIVTAAPLVRAASLETSATTRPAADPTTAPSALRCINIMNFLRGVEPRQKMDLLLPAKEQMKLITDRRLPATWLLQFDALVDGPFVPFLKETMPADHEVGFWFEMNQKLCDAAGVAWRGRPGYEWDHYPDVAFTIGYTPDERIKLADAAMDGFKRAWGRYAKTVASWNLDSITLAHLTDRYEIDACGVCRDQIATDGFTIWGAPIAGYYPSKANLWSPAVDPANQVRTPVFRLLGQDPVYYYDNQFKMPDGKIVREPDTMEPVWQSGRSDQFVDLFLKMIAETATLKFAYAQLGQENNFGWEGMAAGYRMQMDALAKLRGSGSVTVETMGSTGSRFKQAFAQTPPQAQIMLNDPFGNTDPAERSVWYQSRFYRANLHLKGDLPYLRDLTVYSDRYPQPFLNTATRDREVHQRLPAIIDGFHWRKEGDAITHPSAGGFFTLGGQPVRMTEPPKVREEGNSLLVTLPIGAGQAILIRFEEQTIRFTMASPASGPLSIAYAWDRSKGPDIKVEQGQIGYRWQAFDYRVSVSGCTTRETQNGWTAESNGSEIALALQQPSK